jgi:hypothetical protein
MDEAVDQRRGHDLVAEDLAPALEALIAHEDRHRVLVAPADELEESVAPVFQIGR